MNRRGFLKSLGCLAATPVVAKIIPTFLVSPAPQPFIKSYADYVSFADFEVSADAILASFHAEMNYRLGLTLQTLCDMTSTTPSVYGIDFQPVLDLKHYAITHSSDPVSLMA